jgi:hypothetical protein
MTNMIQIGPSSNRSTSHRDPCMGFQIFISGVAARFAYLLDTQTGQTWVFVDDGQGVRAWEPIE